MEAPVIRLGRTTLRHLLRTAVGICMLGLWPACASALAPPAEPFIGVNYGPFHKDGQRPDATAELPEQQIVEDLRSIAAAGFRQIRTYGMDNGLSRIVPLAQRHFPDLRIFLGVYVCGVNHNDPGNLRSTRAQMDEALRLANTYQNVAGVVVGNECLPGEPEACLKPVSVEQLIEDLHYVKKRLSPEARQRARVTSAMSMIAAVREHAALGRRIAGHCDIIMVNIHPFFAPAPIEEAVRSNLDGSFRRLIELYAPTGKTIVIGETGWPSAGPPNGPAVPSAENQRRFIHELAHYARTQALSVFLFEMFDEPWKSEAGGIGPHWGIFNRNGQAKFPLPGWN
jgi:exo-beta-1,3-glucanase (GH17 family)